MWVVYNVVHRRNKRHLCLRVKEHLHELRRSDAATLLVFQSRGAKSLRSPSRCWHVNLRLLCLNLRGISIKTRNPKINRNEEFVAITDELAPSLTAVDFDPYVFAPKKALITLTDYLLRAQRGGSLGLTHFMILRSSWSLVHGTSRWFTSYLIYLCEKEEHFETDGSHFTLDWNE